MSEYAPDPKPGRWSLLTAFAFVYLIWGSTYLAIRFAVETLPPFLMAGARFVLAGGVLYAGARATGAPGARPREWGAAATVGGLLLLGGNGGVVWAEQRVPSGLAALLVSTVPLWVVLLEWVGPERRRPRLLTLMGVAVGLFGVFLLVGSGPVPGEGVDPIGGVVLVLASLSWASGSVISRRLPLPSAPRIATAAEMLTGGALLLLLGLGTGEAGRLHLADVSTASWIALGYLTVFGSLVAFSAYVWLLKVADTAKVATYAYVNPVVALLLGWALADEELTGRTLAAASIILLAVAVITTVRSPRRPAPPSAGDCPRRRGRVRRPP